MKDWWKEGLANYKITETFEFRSSVPLLGTDNVEKIALGAEVARQR
jgi:hypothetical protein